MIQEDDTMENNENLPYGTDPAQQPPKASPFADSPYEMPQQHAAPVQPQEAPQWVPPVYESTASAPSQPKKKHGFLKVFASVVTAAALVAAGCGITAAALNDHWDDQREEYLEVLEKLNDKILELEKEIESNSFTGNGNSLSGTATADGLTPGQVYAQNKNSVVAISNQATTNIYGQVTETASSGSGFIFSSDGYIVTNYHVVEGATTLTVITFDGTEYPATLVGYEEGNDLALLKIDATGLPAAKIGSSNDLIVGDQVVAIGNPLGELTNTLTVGYISAKDRDVTTDGTIINMLQTDAAINPGNSGGPLFNMKGEVIGITTAKYSGTTTSGASIEGIGFAIPFDDVAGMIAELIQNGYISAPYMGIKVTPQTDGIGCYVYSVEANSPAAAAGLQAGDIIRAIGDYDVTSFSELDKALDHFKAGETTSIFVLRGRQILELSITFTEKNAPTGSTVPASSDLPNGGSAEDWFNYWKNYENQD